MKLIVICILTHLLFTLNLLSQDSAGYLIRFRCCFQDSVLVEYNKGKIDTLFIKTDQSVDADTRNMLYFPVADSVNFCYIKLLRSKDSLAIKLPITRSMTYLDVFRVGNNIYYSVKKRFDLLE